MMTEVRIGIIGSGFMGRTHAHSLTQGVKHVSLAGVAGGSRSSQLASDFKTRHYDSPESLASSKDIDAVIIASPHNLHRVHASLCATQRKHALVEKPMAPSLEDCREMIRLFQSNGLFLMVAFTQRFRQSNIVTHDIIRRGTVGRILMVEEYALLPEGLSAYPPWQQKQENLGILFGYGVHNIDKLRWLLQAEVDFVSANVIRSTDGIETSSMATFHWTNGTLTNLWSSVDLPKPGFDGTSLRSRIVGEKGLLDVDSYGEVRLALRGGKWETLFVQPAIDWRGSGMFAEARMGSFNAQNQAFVDAILSGTDPPISGLDGLRAAEIALAVYQSAATHQTIHLNTR